MTGSLPSLRNRRLILIVGYSGHDYLMEYYGLTPQTRIYQVRGNGNHEYHICVEFNQLAIEHKGQMERFSLPDNTVVYAAYWSEADILFVDL
jgi:hypothetical protein